jgi:hypothetical protein
MKTRTELHTAGRLPNECVKTYMANCKRTIRLQPRDTVEEVHVRVREDNTTQRGLVSEKKKKSSGRGEGCVGRAYLMIMVSSISSTP